MTAMTGETAQVRMGWCERRPADHYAPNEHDGSFLHARTPECLHFSYPPAKESLDA